MSFEDDKYLVCKTIVDHQNVQSTQILANSILQSKSVSICISPCNRYICFSLMIYKLLFEYQMFQIRIEYAKSEKKTLLKLEVFTLVCLLKV